MTHEGFILAGGLSSRMGVDKSRLRLGRADVRRDRGRRLAAVADGVSVVGSRAGVESHGLAVVRDVHEGLGALGGLHAALAACGAPWAAVVPCDLPFVTGELFERLASLRGRRSGRGRARAGGRAATAALRALRARALPGSGRASHPRGRAAAARSAPARCGRAGFSFEELSDLDGAQRFFDNVNTPADLEGAREAATQSSL